MTIIQDLGKIIVYVKDMNKQVSFYRDLLDLEVKVPANLDNYGDRVWVELGTGQCSLVFHFDPDKQLGKDRPKLVFKVADLELAHQQLSDRGVRLGQINSRAGNIRVADGCDPEGNPFSIYSQAKE